MTENYHKLSQENVVYVESDPNGNYFCDTCSMFIHGRNECTSVEGYIDEKASCIYYIPGKGAKVDQINPHRLSRCSALYEDSQEGFGCKRCKHFLPKEEECIRVEGKIKPKGCCNAWQHKDQSPHDRHGLMVRMMKKG